MKITSTIKPIVLDADALSEINSGLSDLGIPGGPLAANFVLPKFIADFFDSAGIAHLVTPVSVGQLEASSHQANGTAFFGAGNLTSHYLYEFDHTSGAEFGLETHYRTGDYVDPTLGSDGVTWTATLDKGLQNGLHNEQGSSTTRSAASFDISLNFGTGTPHDNQFDLQVNGHDFFLKHTGTGPATQWFFADDHGNPVQGLTMAPGGHVLQDSANLAFFSSILQHNANAADLKAQDVHIALIETVGTVGVAQVSETIHLV